MSVPSLPNHLALRQSPEKTADQTNTPRKAKPRHKRPLAGLYCRVSSPGQEEDGTSLDTQEARCRHYATEHGYLVDDAHVYREVYTGTELWERPKLTALRSAIRKGAVTHLIAYAIDRLSRDPVHLGVILSEAEHHGAVVEFVSEPLDHSPEGQLIRFVRGYAALVEAEKIRERSVRGKRARLQDGKIHNFGTELYGYRRNKVDGKREVYEPEACMVRQIFRWYAEEKVGVRSIVRWLNGQGIPSPSISKGLWQDLERRPYWNQGQIHRILREPAYKGMTISWRYDKVGRLKPESEWLSLPEGVTPALVGSSLWEAAQKHRTSNTGAQTRNQARPYLLRGMVLCAVCGRKMRPSPESRGRLIYRCSSRETPSGPCGSRRVPAADLEQWTWEQVCHLLRNPSLIAAELERQRQEGPDQRLLADKDALQRSLAKLAQQQSKLLRLFREVDEEVYPVDLIKRELAQIEKEKAHLTAALTQIEAQLAAWQLSVERWGAAMDYCRTVAQNLETFDHHEKRRMLEALAIKVVANGRDWRIKGSIPEDETGGIVSQAWWGWDRPA
jgi:site-specific DNA recombinase